MKCMGPSKVTDDKFAYGNDIKYHFLWIVYNFTLNTVNLAATYIHAYIHGWWNEETHTVAMKKNSKLSFCFEALFVSVILLIRLGRNWNVDSSNSVKSAQSQLDLQKLSIKSLSIIRSFLVWTLQKVNFFHRRRICEEEWVWEQI